MRLARLATAATMSALSDTAGRAMLASPATTDPLFRRIEEVHQEQNKPYGRILDSGTGGHSLKWLATLPKGAVASVTAVTADASAGEGKGAADLVSVLDAARGDRLVEGRWCVAGGNPKVSGNSFDTVLCDYLVGSMDGFTPFEQDRVFGELKSYCAPGALVHVVGLSPVYALMGGDAYAKLSEGEKLVVDTARLRDACILLAAHRPYREYPPAWIIRSLRNHGFEVLDPWKSYGVVWKHATVKRQLDVARRKLPYFTDEGVAKAMSAQIDEMDARARDTLGTTGVTFGSDYVISARLEGGGE
mmetsp:Transcript_9500/g.29584  ORF Transcript_9500/g.29584 Transcript_9500/m.29584 type:complete len:303 (+) Transcript_9500:192-1100(+)